MYILDMGGDNELICPYCSTLYRFDPTLSPRAGASRRNAPSPTWRRPEPGRCGVTAPVLIAGAGIGGLTAALAIARQGLPVTVFDQAERLEEAGAGIQLSPNATRVLIALGLAERIKPAVVIPEAVRLRAGGSGRDIAIMPLGAEAAAPRRALLGGPPRRSAERAARGGRKRGRHHVEARREDRRFRLRPARSYGKSLEPRGNRRAPRPGADRRRRIVVAPARIARRTHGGRGSPGEPHGGRWRRRTPCRRRCAGRTSICGSARAAISCIIRSGPAPP